MKLQTMMYALLFGLTGALAGCEADADQNEPAPKPVEGQLEEPEEPEVIGYTLIEVRALDIPETEADTAGQTQSGDPQAGTQARGDEQARAQKQSADQQAGARAGGSDAPMNDPSFQTATRIKGDKKIPLASEATRIMDATDMERFTMRARVCIDESGTPSSVTIVEPSPYEPHNAKVEKEILTSWRYQPATVNGEPVPSCKRVEFAYEMEDVGKTRPVLFDQEAPQGEDRPESQGIHQP